MENDQRLPPEALSPRAELAKLIEDLEKNPADYEPIAPSAWPPLQVILPEGRTPRRTLFVTKDSILVRWMTENLLPSDSVILCRYGLPTKEYLRDISARLSKARPAIFVGDLDPLDVHAYLSLSYGAVIPKGKPRLRLQYGGLNDACLDLCERNIRKGQRLEAAMIEMGDLEKRHFSILDSMVDVAAIIGDRSRRLLRSGRKLELEGATNAAIFEKGLLHELLDLIGKARLPASEAVR